MTGITLIGNWKMHGDSDLVAQFARVAMPANAGFCGLAVPALILPQAKASLAAKGWKIGGQDASEHAKGAYTGSVSAAMLQQVGSDFCLVGHSERRAYQHETDAQIAGKIARLREAGITPIVCVGETLEEREAGATTTKVLGQLGAVLAELQQCQADGLPAYIAYEPIWAIGTGKTASPEQAAQVHAVIHKLLADQGLGRIQLLYGGSVSGDTLAALASQPHIDGALVGGASLTPAGWQAMFAALDHIN